MSKSIFNDQEIDKRYFSNPVKLITDLLYENKQLKNKMPGIFFCPSCGYRYFTDNVVGGNNCGECGAFYDQNECRV